MGYQLIGGFQDIKDNMKILVTGGAGFIGRWVVKKLAESSDIWVLDNLSNGKEENLLEFRNKLKDFVIGDIRDTKILKTIFKNKFDICIHLAADINVQSSIDDPKETFESNITGTFNLLEEARKAGTKFIFISSALVYSSANRPINESHPLKPASPYAASKIAGENLAFSYYFTYNLPVVVLKPFSAYGPFQKSNMEGGVVSIFIQKSLDNQPLPVFGDGTQTRDFIYVEDCAEFIIKAAFSDKAIGEIINAGSGSDISIKDLALLISNDQKMIKLVPHHHPQAEIQKMVCDDSKASKLLGWVPKTSLKDGIIKTRDWMNNTKAI